jgi:hypothetical protein
VTGCPLSLHWFNTVHWMLTGEMRQEKRNKGYTNRKMS